MMFYELKKMLVKPEAQTNLHAVKMCLPASDA